MSQTCQNRKSARRYAHLVGRLKLPSGISFDHLVGSCEQRWWNGETDGFRGPEVDHELVLDRPLHGQVARLIAFENPIDVRNGLLHVRIDGKAVRYQAAAFCQDRIAGNRREAKSEGLGIDAIPVLGSEWVRYHPKCAMWLL